MIKSVLWTRVEITAILGKIFINQTNLLILIIFLYSNGDSGGPLQITKNINGQKYHEIIGITSFGQYCAAGIPGVYVRISSYLDWIEKNVWPNN
jgi:hypothetical protein